MCSNGGEGGNLDNSFLGTPNYAVSWYLELSAYCAVNCFALITGYVGVNVPYRISRFINLVSGLLLHRWNNLFYLNGSCRAV